MITSLKLLGFQSHARLLVELDPQVTTIVGPSDVGKSAILRALRWVVTNQPAGDAFIRNGEEKAVVVVRTADQKVLRCRGKGKNYYSLNKEPFKAFGTAPPEQVFGILGLTELNFQGQYDPPYWLSESGGEISRQLNQIVSLDLIDSVTGSLAAVQRRSRTEAVVLEDRVESARGDVARWSFAGQLSGDLSDVESLAQKRTETALGRERLQTGLEDAQERGKAAETLREAAERGQEAVAAGVRWQKATESRAALEELIGNLEKLDRIRSRPVPNWDFDELEAVEQRASTKMTRRRSLEAAIRECEAAAKSRDDLREQLAQAQKQFESKMGDSCALCGAAIRKTIGL